MNHVKFSYFLLKHIFLNDTIKFLNKIDKSDMALDFFMNYFENMCASKEINTYVLRN